MHCRSCQWLVALVLLHFVLHVRAHASASRQVTYVLKRLENTCFAQVWTESQKVIFEYQVLRGGNKDVDVQIISPNGMILYEKQKSGRDEVTFIPSNGEFKFCFGNEFSQLSDKVVTFYIQPVRSDSLSEEAGERLPTVKQANEATCDNIHLALTRVADLQRKYRIREAISRHVAEQLNKLVSWWSLCQSLVVVICGVGQVVIMRTFFTERRQSSKPPPDHPQEQHADVTCVM
ncbi:transmembrane emp24 domain-containing protein 3-like isoform X1 [Pomacea canaliculata]|uniref:transmembrane emp24 domain-containing protein 3-like isoform X1 n=1 Tax=Pomacea canaliculata TaxID=400727 RepID=UPI000D72902E|nr:transmembrane emp24 domain-containing protein 3-like isoform X1 [Pomacea canaliculata]XP_025105743.1 transmembrane emp24 domain-containing protein 3-like isoform X1 [Pomacea canaliculata]XP_025105744.1 transmembrane emp24 domain-containing protein 3-like isoform X1 [Pomacea canaliculata]